MTCTAWSAYGPDAVTLDRINPDRIYDDEQQTAHPKCAGGVEQKGPSLPDTCSAPSPIHDSSLEKLGESSKAAAPIFSNRDRLQLIADGE